MIDTIAAACEALQREPGFNDFWVVSALPDFSYEEGVRNKKFRSALGLYRDADMDPDLLDCAALGINGNLQEGEERRPFHFLWYSPAAVAVCQPLRACYDKLWSD